MLALGFAPAAALAQEPVIASATPREPSPVVEVRASGGSLRAMCDSWREDAEPVSFVMPLGSLAPPLGYVDGQLRATLGRPLLVEDGPTGRVEVFLGGPVSASARLPIAEGAHLMREQEKGRLQMVLGFQAEPGELTAAPCLRLGGQIIRVRIRPMYLSLLDLSYPSASPSAGANEQIRLFTEGTQPLPPLSSGPGADSPVAGRSQPEVRIPPKDVVFDGEAGPDPLAQGLPALRDKAGACYGRALAKKPGLAGRVIVGAQLDEQGRMADAHIEIDAAGEAGLGHCLVEAVQSSRLPGPRHGGHISLPITLRPGKQ